MPPMLRRVAPLLLLSVLPACSDTQTGPGAHGDPLGTMEKFCAAFAKLACNAKVVTACAAADAEACQATQAAFCAGLVPGAGYTSEAAKACLSAVETAYADAVLTPAELAVVRGLAAPCDQLVAGEVEAGGSCTERWDCDTLEGFDCVRAPGVTSGSCQIPEERGGGQSCGLPAQTCAVGFYCNGSYCIERAQAGASCSESVPCGEALLCSGGGVDGGAGGTCVVKATTGGACGSGAECASGLCAIAAGSSAGVCVDQAQLTPTEPLCNDLR